MDTEVFRYPDEVCRVRYPVFGLGRITPTRPSLVIELHLHIYCRENLTDIPARTFRRRDVWGSA